MIFADRSVKAVNKGLRYILLNLCITNLAVEKSALNAYLNKFFEREK